MLLLVVAVTAGAVVAAGVAVTAPDVAINGVSVAVTGTGAVTGVSAGSAAPTIALLLNKAPTTTVATNFFIFHSSFPNRISIINFSCTF